MPTVALSDVEVEVINGNITNIFRGPVATASGLDDEETVLARKIDDRLLPLRPGTSCSRKYMSVYLNNQYTQVMS